MSEAYVKDSFFSAYFKWHYGRGLKEFFEVAKNFLWFLTHFFSFKLLLRTLFAPWKRLGERYQGGLDFGALAGSLIVNSLMRGVGFVTKIIVLSVGFLACLLVLFASLLLFLLWLALPVILLGCLILAVTFISISI